MAEEESTQIQRNQIRGLRLKPRSKVWEHFTRDTDDDGNEIAKCKRCGKVYAYHGTKNQLKHLQEGCGWQESGGAGISEQPPQPLPSLAQDDEDMQQFPPLPPVPLPLPFAPSHHGESSDRNSSSLQEEACRHLARMFALRGYDASVLEDDCFKSFVRRLNPEFEVPSRIAIENMCDGIFDEARKDHLDRLRRAPGKVNFAVGTAKTMDEQVFYVACHFIDDGWNLHKLLLHAIVTTDHRDDFDGPILGFRISTDDDFTPRVITDFGIYNSLFMVAYGTTEEEIISLKSELPDNSNSKEILFTTFADNVLHSIARCLLPRHKFTDQLCCGMNDLLLTRQGRLELLEQLDLNYRLAYDEHWYACYCSLAVLCNKGFSRQLTDAELLITKLLCHLWEKIYRAIQKISSSTRPTANLYLAELFRLREILESEEERFRGAHHGHDYNVFEDVKDVMFSLREACVNLEMAIQDSYMAWSLPLALDPRYKLKFITFNFERLYGLEAAKEYVSEVTAMIMKLYDDYIKQYGTTGGAHHSDVASAMGTTTSAYDPLEQAWNEHCRSQQGMSIQVISSCYPEAETELDRYLNDPLASHHPQPQAEGFDILNWWKAHSSEYPMVARMARDALAMPTCSKLSFDQMAQLRSILRGYSEKPYKC